MIKNKQKKTDSAIVVPISHPGVYLYRGTHCLELDINRELVIVFAAPCKAACGLIYYHPDSNPKELFIELDTLQNKLRNEFKLQSTDIQIKAFGLANGPSYRLAELQAWAKLNKIKIVAKDTGRNVHRSLRVDCATGRVSVSYSKRIFPSKTEFLSLGTARNRNPLDHVQTEVLILSQTRVKRVLAKQAIEEFPNYTANVPAEPHNILCARAPKDFAWSVVLLFDDLKEQEEILPWLIAIRKGYPSVQFRWVGSSLPSFGKQFPWLRLLPPLEAELLPDFKLMLRQAVFEASTGSTSAVLPFPQKRRAR